MVYNVCENAVKYNYENGKVSVWAGNTLNGPKISVSDTGIGIPKENIKYIFETYDLYGLKAIQELLVKENPEIRIARKDDKIVLYVPHNIDIELNLDLSNYKSIAIDLTRRYVSPLQTINGKTSIIKMTYFNRDALYILEKDV